MRSYVVLYNTADGADESNLWSTNASVAGTFEIGGLNSTGIVGASAALNPFYLTAFEGEVLFEGQDNSGLGPGLWVTNGTAGGTHEIGGPGSTGIANANPTGLYPGQFDVYGSEVLFQGAAGVGGNDVFGLWVTNGTAAGTYEIGGAANAGIANVSPGGLIPGGAEFTNFNGVVLFSGRDAANNQGLWETNGTAQGTFELAPIAGAFAVGSPGSDVLGSLGNMTVFGNYVMFRGTDLQDTEGSLWITDGTAGGTYELGGQANAGITGAPAGFSNPFASSPPIGMVPDDLTTFGSEVIFAAYDNTLTSGQNGYAHTDALWISNGNATGTVEIGGSGNAGIVGANSAVNGGIFWNGSIAYPDFTVYGNEVLFVGYDASNHSGLWETNGTAAGTVEIGGQNNAGIAGGLTLSNTDSPDFTLYNGGVLFRGTDGMGRSELFVTDGTAAGTHEVLTPSLGLPNAFLGNNFTPISLYGPPTEDFNGARSSDVLFQSGGSIVDWIMQGGTYSTYNSIGNASGYGVVGTGDFNNDGTTDLLLQNAGGSLIDWILTNGGYWGYNPIGNPSPAGYGVIGTGQFAGGQSSDVLLENGAGNVIDWIVSNGVYGGYNQVGNTSGYAYAGTGDFNGDGTSDILLQKGGNLIDWIMQNGEYSSYNQIGNPATAGYGVVGTGDFNGDGTTDVLLENGSGNLIDWTIQNGMYAGYNQIGNATGYAVVGTGDYNGDGTTDIMLENSSGNLVDWMMQNGTYAGYHSVGNAAGYNVINKT